MWWVKIQISNTTNNTNCTTKSKNRILQKKNKKMFWILELGFHLELVCIWIWDFQRLLSIKKQSGREGSRTPLKPICSRSHSRSVTRPADENIGSWIHLKHLSNLNIFQYKSNINQILIKHYVCWKFQYYSI